MHADDANDDADDRWPKGEEEKQTWSDGVGIGVRPKAYGCGDDYER
jgi:hypothetical protein